MELLNNGFSLQIPNGCFPLSTDSMLLAEFVRLAKNTHVLDLGAGCGTLGILLCSRNANCHVTGVEIDRISHEAAIQNILRNELSHRMDSIHADITTLSADAISGQIQVVVSNPPYFTGGAPHSRTPQARQESGCPLPALCARAAAFLHTGGDFYIVHKPEVLGRLCATCVQEKLEPKRLRLVRHRQDGPVSLILLHCRKDAKPGLVMEEMALHTASGEKTDYYRKVYQL